MYNNIKPIKIKLKGKDSLFSKSLISMNHNMSDPDKDGYPNAIDCSDLDPNKQGPISWVMSKIQKKPYQEVETERYAHREMKQERRHNIQMTRAKREVELEEQRKPIQEARYHREQQRLALDKERVDIQSKKEALQERRQRSMPKMSMMGMGGPSMMGGPDLFGGPKPATQPVKRKKRRKQKRKKR